MRVGVCLLMFSAGLAIPAAARAEAGAKPKAAAVGCRGSGAAFRRVLAGELELVAPKALSAEVRRSRVDSKTAEGVASLSDVFELELVVRCTKGQGGKKAMIEIVDANGSVLGRRPLASAKKRGERQALAAWIAAGARDAISAGGAVANEETHAPDESVAAAEEEVIKESAEPPAEVTVVETDPPSPEKVPLVARSVEKESLVAQSGADGAGESPASEDEPSLSSSQESERETRAIDPEMRAAGTVHSNIAPAEAPAEPTHTTATLLAGVALRGEARTADLLLRTQPFGRTALHAALESGLDEDKNFRFHFSAAYLFDLFGASLGPNLGIGLDRTAPGSTFTRGSDRVARAGLTLLIPLVTEALVLRAEGAYRPIFDENLTSIFAHGYAAGGSIEGTFEVGLSYALRAELQSAQDDSQLALGALLGWRL